MWIVLLLTVSHSCWSSTAALWKEGRKRKRETKGRQWIDSGSSPFLHISISTSLCVSLCVSLSLSRALSPFLYLPRSSYAQIIRVRPKRKTENGERGWKKEEATQDGTSSFIYRLSPASFFPGHVRFFNARARVNAHDEWCSGLEHANRFLSALSRVQCYILHISNRLRGVFQQRVCLLRRHGLTRCLAHTNTRARPQMSGSPQPYCLSCWKSFTNPCAAILCYTRASLCLP